MTRPTKSSLHRTVAGFQSQFPPICDWTPPTVPPRKISRLSFIRQGETKKQKQIFLSNKNKGRKIKRKKKKTVPSKRSQKNDSKKNQAKCQGYGTGDTQSEECYNLHATISREILNGLLMPPHPWLCNRNTRWRMAGGYPPTYSYLGARSTRQPTLLHFSLTTSHSRKPRKTRKGVFYLKKSAFQLRISITQ